MSTTPVTTGPNAGTARRPELPSPQLIEPVQALDADPPRSGPRPFPVGDSVTTGDAAPTGDCVTTPADEGAASWPTGAGAGLYGPRGWTVSCGAWEVLARCRRGRAALAGPRTGTVPPGVLDAHGAPVEDYTPFTGLGPHGARRLLEVLPPVALEDRQNLGPSLGALLRACDAADGDVLLSGYGIGPQRHDERVTVEALWVHDEDLAELDVREEHDEHCQCRELWRTVRQRLRLDAEAMPDEVRLVSSSAGTGEVGWRLWWD